MRGYTIYSLLLCVSCISFSQMSHNDYDTLTEQMIGLNVQTQVAPPSRFMLFLRKLSIVPLIFYKGYRYLCAQCYAIRQYVKRKKGLHRQRR